MPHSRPLSASFLRVKDTGHEHAKTSHIPFIFAQQTASPAAYGYDFFVSVPPDYMKQPEKQWPLIVFLHGAGESQQEPNESYACLRHGVPKIILCYDALMSGAEPQVSIPKALRLREHDPAKPDRSAAPVPPDVCRAVAEEFVTLTPVLDLSKQHQAPFRPRPSWLINKDNGYGWSAPVLSNLLAEVLPHFRVDRDRIHATGFSMGGDGVWSLALDDPARFASLTPVCARAGDAGRVGSIAHVPVWVHHGELDGVHDVEESARMAEALRGAGAADVKCTRYADLGHDCWTAAYSDVGLWRWMLERKRGEGSRTPERKII